MWGLFRLSLLFVLSGSVYGQSLTIRLDSLLASCSATEPGMAVLVYRQGTVLYQHAVGRAEQQTDRMLTSQSLFRLASVSKQFTARAILNLEKQNKLRLEDPIRKFFPEFNPQVGEKVTIRQLLTHTSGIRDYEELMDTTRRVLDEDVVRLLQNEPATYFSPGQKFRYSNSGFCLLAMIVQNITGKPYAEFLRNEVFLPAKMMHSFLYDSLNPVKERAIGYAMNTDGKIVESDQSLTSMTRGDGCVYTSPEDYLQWHRYQNPAFLKKLRDVQYRFPELPGYGYGLGWFVYQPQNKSVELFHSGTTCGFSTAVIRIPEKDQLLVYFSNRAYTHEFFGKILHIIREEKAIDTHMDWKAMHERTN